MRMSEAALLKKRQVRAEERRVRNERMVLPMDEEARALADTVVEEKAPETAAEIIHSLAERTRLVAQLTELQKQSGVYEKPAVIDGAARSEAENAIKELDPRNTQWVADALGYSEATNLRVRTEGELDAARAAVRADEERRKTTPKNGYMPYDAAGQGPRRFFRRLPTRIVALKRWILGQ